MEIEQAHHHKMHVFFAEMFGTAWLCFAVCLQASFPVFGVFGIAFTLFGNILLWGNITGGNFNPAVTLGVLLQRHKDICINIFMFLISTSAQFLGGLLGIGMAGICMWQFTKGADDRAVPILEPANNCDSTNTFCASESTIGAFVVEMVCSFFFILIILMVKDPITAPSKEGYLCCWTVGVTLLG